MTKEDEEYNGWANYETGNCALWIDNGGLGENYREQAAQLFEETDADDKPEDRIYEATNNLAAQIENDFTEEFYPQEVKGFYADVLNAAVRMVDWYEIASHYVEDVAEEAAQ